MRLLYLALITLLLGCQGADNREQYLAFQASVHGQQLLSNDFPVGSLTFDSTLTYVGSESFILYDVARCEIHLYADADDNRRVNRMYWIQYESYLPSLLPKRYDYSEDPYRTEIGGREFYDSVNYYNVALSKKEWREDSDIMHVFKLLAREGYNLDSDVMRIRLVHLDKSKKKELMIMYIEAMDRQGLSIKAFGKEGKMSKKWEEVSRGLRERALAGIEAIFD